MKRYAPNFKPPSKYRAQKTTMDGITFDSKAEATGIALISWSATTPALCGWRMSRALRQRGLGSSATFGGRLLGASRSESSKMEG